MTRIDRAREMRAATALAAQGASDEQALTMGSLYPEWAAGVAYGGEKQPSFVTRMISEKMQVYRCQQPHTSQTGWEPENTPALWVAINKTNAGTQEDPIPAVRGMEYTYGLHYIDPEDGNTYLCERTGAVEGETIVLQYLPHELVGQYFAEVI